jgi:hypothetical protein
MELLHLAQYLVAVRMSIPGKSSGMIPTGLCCVARSSRMQGAELTKSWPDRYFPRTLLQASPLVSARKFIVLLPHRSFRLSPSRVNGGDVSSKGKERSALASALISTFLQG